MCPVGWIDPDRAAWYLDDQGRYAGRDLLEAPDEVLGISRTCADPGARADLNGL